MKRRKIMDTIIIEKEKYGNNHFELFKWVMLARSKEQNRYQLQYVNIGKNRVICCDGMRIHMFRHSRTYTPGMYEVRSQDKKSIVLTKTTEGTYPHIKQVIPKHGGVKLDFYNKKISRGRSYTSVIRKMEENYTINLDYFEDCITEGQWRVSIQPNGGPLYFKNSEKSAVIMPVRIE